MRKINFNVGIKGLNGKELRQGKEVILIKDVISNALSISKPINSAIKQINLALKIYNSKEEIEVDDGEIEIIKIVTEQMSASALVISQILKLIE